MPYVAGINFESVVDGEGVRVTIFFSGCKHNCKGCHNPSSHSFEVGRPFSEELQEQIITYIGNTPFISGVTLSGGDPMYSAAELTPFVHKLHTELPHINIWLYTGFTYEELLIDQAQATLLSLCDVIVDGMFILEQRDITLLYRGSRNQRIIDVRRSIETGAVVLWKSER